MWNLHLPMADKRSVGRLVLKQVAQRTVGGFGGLGAAVLVPLRQSKAAPHAVERVWIVPVAAPFGLLQLHDLLRDGTDKVCVNLSAGLAELFRPCRALGEVSASSVTVDAGLLAHPAHRPILQILRRPFERPGSEGFHARLVRGGYANPNVARLILVRRLRLALRAPFDGQHDKAHHGSKSCDERP